MLQLPLQMARVVWAGISTALGTFGCISHAKVSQLLHQDIKENNWNYLTWWADVNTKGIQFIPHYSNRLMNERKPCIFVVNHQSFFDIFAIILTAPWYIRFVGKKSLFKIPVLGNILRHLGAAEIDRKNRDQAITELKRVVQEIQDYSLVIFAEGTRSRDGKLQPFKKGAFHLAIDYQVPIVPVTIRGSGRIMPVSSWKVVSGQIDVIYGDPIDTTGLSKKDIPTLIEQTRSEILKQLAL